MNWVAKPAQASNYWEKGGCEEEYLCIFWIQQLTENSSDNKENPPIILSCACKTEHSVSKTRALGQNADAGGGGGVHQVRAERARPRHSGCAERLLSRTRSPRQQVCSFFQTTAAVWHAQYETMENMASWLHLLTIICSWDVYWLNTWNIDMKLVLASILVYKLLRLFLFRSIFF